MKRYIITLIISIMILGIAAEIHSGAGEYGYQFLNIPLNPSAMALAGRGMHSDGNNANWLWQPSAGTDRRAKTVNAAHHTWIGDTAYTSLVYSYAQRRSHMGLALINLSYGEIEKRDETGQLIGHYAPADIAVKGNYALRMTPSWYLGANLGLLYQKIDTASSLALVTDLGSTWIPPIQDSKISLAMRNLGVSNKTSEEKTKLPLRFDMDAYKGFRIAGHHLGLEASLSKAVDDNIRYSTALEMGVLDNLFLRGGYQNADATSFSAGIGFQVLRLNVDYGFAAYTDGLSDVHSFGLTYHF